MKKRIIYLVGCMLSIFLLVACKQEAVKSNSANNTNPLVWHKQREKRFGVYDYPSLTKKEAIDLLKNKFQLQLPKMIKQAENMFENEIVTNEVVADKIEYSVFVTEEQVQVRGYYPFNRGNELAVFAYLDFVYTYDIDKKMVRLKSQSFSMSNYGEEAIYPKDNFNQLVKSTSDLIEVQKNEFDHAEKNFTKNYGEVDQRPNAEKIIFYSNDEEMQDKKGISQSIRIGFNDKREMREIYAALVDYTE